MPGAPPDTARLFFALWPDDATRARLAACQQAWQWPRGVRLVPPGRLHLTLHFLARVPRDRVAALMQHAAVPLSPFELVLDSAGTWPAGVAWLQPSAAPGELLALHAHIGAALREQGCELETRGFQPHVTLARDARAAVPPAEVKLVWRIDGYALVESRLGSGGGYSVLHRYDAQCS